MIYSPFSLSFYSSSSGFLRWMAEKNEKLLVIRFCSFVFFNFFYVFVRVFSLQADFVVLYLGYEEVNKYQNEKSMRLCLLSEGHYRWK
jgi:hypothetical protein